MTGIERSGQVLPSKLSGEFYTQSLLDEGRRTGLLSAEDEWRFQLAVLDVLAVRAARYTGGNSASVRMELAQALLDSILYVIGVYLKGMAPEQAISLLRTETPQTLYEKGRKRVLAKMAAAKHLYRIMVSRMPDVRNTIFQDTVLKGIPGFFKLYDPAFFAQEIHITADYPLLHPIQDLVGIEFIVRYLECLCYENRFLNRFPAGLLHRALLDWEPDYPAQIFNLAGAVLEFLHKSTRQSTETVLAGLELPEGTTRYFSLA